MKKGLKIFLFILFGMIVLFFGAYLCITIFLQGSLTCISEGHYHSSPSLGPEGVAKSDCCEGLSKISTIHPNEEGFCRDLVGSAYICSNCGNGICEGWWENPCSCPQDCFFGFECSTLEDCSDIEDDGEFIPALKCENNKCYYF
jgi:hypothetical protein